MIKHLLTRLLAGAALIPLLFIGVVSAPSGASTAPRVATVSASYLGHYRYEVTFTLSAQYSFIVPGTLWISQPTSSPLACAVKVVRPGRTKCEVNLATATSALAYIGVRYNSSRGAEIYFDDALKTHLPKSVTSPTNLQLPLIAPATESCTSPGNCVAVGAGAPYLLGAYGYVAVTDTEVAGTWGVVQYVTFASTVDTDGASILTNVACPSVGNCTAVGTDASGLFAVGEVAGAWTPAQDISKGSMNNANGGLTFSSVACANADTCLAIGNNNGENPFVVADNSGVWGAAQAIALVKGSLQKPPTLTCTASGTCRVVGLFKTNREVLKQFTYLETDGAKGDTTVKVLSGALAWAESN